MDRVTDEPDTSKEPGSRDEKQKPLSGVDGTHLEETGSGNEKPQPPSNLEETHGEELGGSHEKAHSHSELKETQVPVAKTVETPGDFRKPVYGPEFGKARATFEFPSTSGILKFSPSSTGKLNVPPVLTEKVSAQTLVRRWKRENSIEVVPVLT
jgi:hypothetical protein